MAESFSFSKSLTTEPTDSWDYIADFTLAEIVEMENIYKEIGEAALSQVFCQQLAKSFSCSTNRVGKSAVTWEQVKTWFQEKQKESRTKSTLSPMALELFVDLSGTNISKNVPIRFKKPKGDIVKDLTELAFEAKSAKDNAWYDVASFLTYRVLHSGELEVRVRFLGFRNTDDEWVNVKRAVRQRSIPLEPSECSRVKVGDLVLCFQERADHAVYRDAHVVEIKRLLHDSTCCTCDFLVRFDHDNSEERVSLERVCCRPADELCSILPII